ncbi:filamentous hemagglutinin N-terminal domain-containing protein [Desulfococcaceae bacterium HSG8]|nr:filamentous hemagglutinin N-terminal domain-containing protein [Desulfococcaceae bacterium HSG8]
MKRKRQCFSALILSIIISYTAYADDIHPRGITLDGTLGNAGKLELPGPDYEIRSEYGRQTSGNLFHSFQQFNIHADESATFSGQDSVQNIIARVTGGDSSWIDGKLVSTIPGADLYLLNSAGLMFGPNASLDLGGSFHISTADYLRMGNNEIFYASPIENDVLSAAPPTGFGFLDDDAGHISFEGGEVTALDENLEFGGFSIQKGKTVSVVGGTIEIRKGLSYQKQRLNENGDPVFEEAADENGGPLLDNDGNPVLVLDENGEPVPVIETIKPANIRAPGGQINITAFASEGEAEIGNPSPFSTLGNIKISDEARIDVSGDNGGSVYIRGGNFELANSIITANTSQGDSGETDIQVRELSVTQGGQLNAMTSGPGQGGDIKIQAENSVTISGKNLAGQRSMIYSKTDGTSDQAGNGGTVEITAGELNLDEGARIHARSFGNGDSGDIKIQISNTVTLSGEGTEIRANPLGKTDQAGKGGAIELSAGTLDISGGSMIDTTSASAGQGGNINIQVAGSISLSGESSNGRLSRISSDAVGKNEGAGGGGMIELKAEQLNITEGAQISSTSFGPGPGGNMKIRVSDTVGISGISINGEYAGGIFANAEAEGNEAGIGGTLELTAQELHIAGGGRIGATTSGAGQGGDIKVQIGGSLMIEGRQGDFNSAIISRTLGETEFAGSGGKIELKAEQLYLTEGGKITATSKGTGQGGDIKIHVRDIAALSGEDTEGWGSSILANAQGKTEKAGNGGMIELEAGRLNLSDGGMIGVSSHGPGQGGDISIRITGTADISGSASQYASGIFSNTNDETEHGGDGGSIEVSAEHISLNNGAKISAFSKGGGHAGEIHIDVSQLDSDNGAMISSKSKAAENGGDAGTIIVNAKDSLRLSGNSALTTEAESAGGGKIFVNAGEIYLFRGEITSSVRQGEGKGGDVTIGPHPREDGQGGGPKFVIINSGNITANADFGDGGAIFIHTDNYIKSSASSVTATSRRGNDGTVKIEAPDVDISSDLVTLPASYIDAARWMKVPCSARAGEKMSHFVIKGQNAVPTAFEDWQPSVLTWFDDAGGSD